jgi:hypothetical protein
MPDNIKDKVVAKKLKCGGTAIYTIDPKLKQLVQTGYIGANLSLDAYLPKSAEWQK